MIGGSRFKIFSSDLLILAAGCAVLAGVLWQGQRVAAVLVAADDIKGRVLGAVTDLSRGQAALAEGDFSASTQAFANAQALISQAEEDLNEALSISQHILQAIDVTGTVRSGTNLLEVTNGLARTGSALTNVVQKISQEESLTDGLSASRQDLEAAATELGHIEDSLAKIDIDAIPAESRSQFEQLQTIIPKVRQLVAISVAQADVFLSLLGADYDRQYLVLLTNNHELRPVGGFIGTVALVNIDRGKVENIDVSSVYEGDGQLKQIIAPPSPLLPIVDRWYLRDTNWFVDFPVSARKAAEFFEKEGGPTVDGVILMTPDVIKRFLAVTGPIDMPGYNQTVSAENFVAITQQEVTYEYDKELNRPKQFLADLTPLLLNRVFAEESNKLQTLQAFTQSLAHKEIVLYFRDEATQEQIQKFNWAGAIPQNVSGMLHVNNANIGGHKSDQFIDQEIDQRVQVLPDGSAEVIVTIRRTHRGPFEGGDYEYPPGEDPTQKNNVVFQRVLVPNNAELLEAKGFTPSSKVPRYVTPDSTLKPEADAEVASWQSGQEQTKDGTIIGQEAGHTFFANWLLTEPGQTSVGLYRYRIPKFVDMPGILNRASSSAVSFIKQTGDTRSNLRLELILPAEYTIVHTTPQEGITRENDSSMTYRGPVQSDTVVGIVFEKK